MLLYKVLTIIDQSGETVNAKAFLRMINELFNIREHVFMAINSSQPARMIPLS